MSEKSARIKKLVLLAMFTAIAAVLITLVHFPLFPSAAFLQYDPADVPILIAAFAFGPVAGLIVTVLASFIQAFFLDEPGQASPKKGGVLGHKRDHKAGSLVHFSHIRASPIGQQPK